MAKDYDKVTYGLWIVLDQVSLLIETLHVLDDWLD